MKKRILCLLLAICILASLSACGEKKQSVSVTIVNRSGQTIGDIRAALPDSETWGPALLSAPLADGASANIELGSYSAGELEQGLCLQAYDENDAELYGDTFGNDPIFFDSGDYLIFMPSYRTDVIYLDSSYDPAKYDALLNDAEAEPTGSIEPGGSTQDSDSIPADFIGLWKYESEPIYIAIYDDATWVAVNLYGSTAGPSPCELQDDSLALYLDGGSFMTSFSFDANGCLIDSDGNRLYMTDSLTLLPTPDDELTQTISFPNFSPTVSISYPATMSGKKHPNLDRGLSFNALAEDGTDDYWSNICFELVPVSGYDSYMSMGYSTAKKYMQHMLYEIIESNYPGKLIKSIASDCVDGGWYYGITGYVWLDGSVFPESPSTPVRATFEVRYVGPTGYVLSAAAISLENRIQNYYDICCKMLESCDYGGDWSTAPKARPSAPAQSDPGDYGTAYYWYDSDGDVWYWNGYENEFICYGSDGYIDTDGQYYESNDAGWDYWDEGWGDDFDYYDDYDPWSDPGDGYDAWSDPGDYYDGYNEGWGDYFD